MSLIDVICNQPIERRRAVPVVTTRGGVHVRTCAQTHAALRARPAGDLYASLLCTCESRSKNGSPAGRAMVGLVKYNYAVLTFPIAFGER